MNRRLVEAVMPWTTWIALGCSSPGADALAPASNHAPEVQDIEAGAYFDREYRQIVRVSDPDGDPVAVAATTLPSWLSFQPDSLLLSGIPDGWDIGQHRVVLRATDGRAATTRVFTLRVEVGPCRWRSNFGDPAESEYVMPFLVGREVEVLQPSCGWRNHDRDNQQAVDFRTPFGDTIVASRAGRLLRVVDSFSDTDKDGAHFNYIHVLHADSTIAFYAHLKQGSVMGAVGDLLEQGQPIALMGESGTPTLCPLLECGVLHFGVYGAHQNFDIAVTFRNAGGPVDHLGALVEGATYEVLAYGPSG